MPTRRKEVILATKLSGRKADDAKRQIELSLKRLQTDHLDVLHIHALSGPRGPGRDRGPDGVLKALYEARDQKIARAIGITCHADPAALKTALERHDFDCTQMALNAAMARMADAPGGMKATPMAAGGFEELALPVAVRKRMGVIAMKVFGQDQLVGAAPDREAAHLLPLAARQPGECRHAEARVHRAERRTGPSLPADVRRRETPADGLDRRGTQGRHQGVSPAA